MPVQILVVDDHSENRMALRAILSSPDYRIVEAVSGAEALLRLLQEDFAVLLIDVVMPGMDGGDIVAQLRSDPDLKEIPVMMLTALVEENPDTPDGETQTGGLPFLSKTSSLERLLTCIEKHLAEKGSKPGPAY